MTNFLRGSRLLWLAVTTEWLIAATTALAGESIWNHNGSIMRWVGVGPECWMSFLDPRPGRPSMDALPHHHRREKCLLIGQENKWERPKL